MKELTLTAERRDIFGKKTRFLRRRGIIPANVFGHGVASVALQCEASELKKVLARAGMTRLISLKIDGEKEPKSVFIRSIQRDPLGESLLHVDFYQVKKGERMMMDVPIVLVGEAPAMKGKRHMLIRGITMLSIECLPEKVPPQIEVDISKLEQLDQAIHVKDITLDPDITVYADPEQLIVKVAEAEEEKPAVVAEAVAEGAEEAKAAGPASEATQARAEKPERPEKPEKT